jgi:hypothetical protein
LMLAEGLWKALREAKRHTSKRDLREAMLRACN